MRIADIFPDGRAILVSDGIIKARYRVIDSVEVKVWATAWALNYPRFEANPNNGGPFVRDNPMYPSTSVREKYNNFRKQGMLGGRDQSL